MCLCVFVFVFVCLAQVVQMYWELQTLGFGHFVVLGTSIKACTEVRATRAHATQAGSADTSQHPQRSGSEDCGHRPLARRVCS